MWRKRNLWYTEVRTLGVPVSFVLLVRFVCRCFSTLEKSIVQSGNRRRRDKVKVLNRVDPGPQSLSTGVPIDTHRLPSKGLFVIRLSVRYFLSLFRKGFYLILQGVSHLDIGVPKGIRSKVKIKYDRYTKFILVDLFDCFFIPQRIIIRTSWMSSFGSRGTYRCKSPFQCTLGIPIYLRRLLVERYLILINCYLSSLFHDSWNLLYWHYTSEIDLKQNNNLCTIFFFCNQYYLYVHFSNYYL